MSAMLKSQDPIPAKVGLELELRLGLGVGLGLGLNMAMVADIPVNQACIYKRPCF